MIILQIFATNYLSWNRQGHKNHEIKYTRKIQVLQYVGWVGSWVMKMDTWTTLAHCWHSKCLSVFDLRWQWHCGVFLVGLYALWMLYSESNSHVTSATKRPAIALEDDIDDEDCTTCPSTLSDHEPPEVLRRRQPPQKNVDDELVVLSPPTGSGFQLMTTSSGVAALPPLAAYRSAAHIPAPPPNATAFQLVAFHNIYASQQQQQQLMQTHHLPPHLRFSLFSDVSATPGM